jgi:hypothetical protein
MDETDYSDNHNDDIHLLSDYMCRKTALEFYPIEIVQYDICESGCQLFDHDSTQQYCFCGKARYEDQKYSNTPPKPKRQMKVITISSQLSLLIYHSQTRHLIEQPIQRQSNGNYGDIFTGTCIQDLLQSINSPAIYIGMYIDGFTAKNRKDYSMVLIHFVILSFPPTIRYKNSYMLNYCLIPGPVAPKKAQYWTFLDPLLVELHSLEKFGIRVVCDDGVTRIKKVHCLFFTGDLPGIAPLAGHSGHMCFSPCRMCIIQGFDLLDGTKAGRYVDPLKDSSLRLKQDFIFGDPDVSCISCGNT